MPSRAPMQARQQVESVVHGPRMLSNAWHQTHLPEPWLCGGCCRQRKPRFAACKGRATQQMTHRSPAQRPAAAMLWALPFKSLELTHLSKGAAQAPPPPSGGPKQPLSAVSPPCSQPPAVIMAAQIAPCQSRQGLHGMYRLTHQTCIEPDAVLHKQRQQHRFRA